MINVTNTFPTPRMVTVGDVSFAVYEDGPTDGRPVLLLHGWPELAYSWKLIMPALADAGYRVIAPDMKGFGRSSRPDDVQAYGMDVMTRDLVGLIDALGYQKIIIGGHDWGGAHVWPMAYTYPDKIEGVIGICTPHRERAPAPPVEIFREKFSSQHYIVQYQDAALPDIAFGGREEDFVAFMFRKAPARKTWPALGTAAYDLVGRFKNFTGGDEIQMIMPPADRAVFARVYASTGHRTPTHVYRNVDHNWRITEGVDLTIHQPVLMLSAELDLVLPPESCEKMPDLCKDLEFHIIEDCGHWAMWEKPKQLNRLMLEWLGKKFPT